MGGEDTALSTYLESLRHSGAKRHFRDADQDEAAQFDRNGILKKLNPACVL
jgi:hypothetical protein